MTWLAWMMLAILLASVAALTGIKPKRTRPVAGTQLMGVARVVLLIGSRPYLRALRQSLTTQVGQSQLAVVGFTSASRSVTRSIIFIAA